MDLIKTVFVCFWILLLLQLIVLLWVSVNRLWDRSFAFLFPVLALIPTVVLFLALRTRPPIPAVGVILPWIKDLFAYERQLQQNIRELEKFRSALELYGSWPASLDPEELARRLPANQQDNAVEWCAREVAAALKLGSHTALLLLRDGRSQWLATKAAAAPTLAQTLLRSPQIRDHLARWSAGEKELQRLISDLDEFSPAAASQAVSALNQVCQHASDFLTFVAEEGVALRDTRVTAGDVLDRLPRGWQADLDGAAYGLFMALADARMQSTLPGPLAHIAVALYVARRRPDRSTWQSRACREAAREPYSHKLALAYLILESRVAEGERVTIGEINDHWERTVDDWRDTIRPAKGKESAYDHELRNIKENLTNGHWQTTLSGHLRQTIHKAGTSPAVTPLLKALTQDPHRRGIERALRHVCDMLEKATVKRFLEARTVHPYLITFHAGHGTVAALLDYMQAPASLPRDLQVKLEGRYGFQAYTDNVRLGVVPKGQTFGEFWALFRRDFRTLVKLHPALHERGYLKGKTKFKEVEGMELIMHQFGLSVRDFFGFEMENVTKERAIDRLKTLFGSALDPEDIVGLVEYEGRLTLTDALLNAPLADIVAGEAYLTKAQSETLEDRDATLRRVIDGAVARKHGVSLGAHLSALPEGDRARAIDAATTALWREVASSGHFKEEGCRKIAVVYLETLAAIFTIAPKS